MYLSAQVPQIGVRRSKHGLRSRPRRIRHFSGFGSSSNGGGEGRAKRPVLIALIDPKPLTRQSLLEMLAGALPEHVALVGASCLSELLEKTEQTSDFPTRVNFIILYIRSAGVSDTWVQEQLHLIKLRDPQIPVIMMSDRDDSADVINALNQGVRGYIPTSIAAEVAIAALTLIEAGGTYIPVDVLHAEGAEICGDAQADEPANAPNGLNLTLRELAVIDLLREGNSNKLIALKLNMRESTVKVHVRNILKKLRVSNRTHAATVANRLLAHAIPGATSETKNPALITEDKAPTRPH
jgi:DNA-binding NarL/FixJ family response regulator